MLTKAEAPDTGKVEHAEQIEIAYFEQNRESLDPKVTVYNTICPLGDYVDFKGTKVHARSYLNRFLFFSDQMDMPVGKLSGGEQSRLLLARLMLKSANVLILDEPTNDLDMNTLDVLQEVLEEFNGAVILVTHDRYFLDQVTNQILAFAEDANGHRTIERFADLSQWESWQKGQTETRAAKKTLEPSKSKSDPNKQSSAEPVKPKRKLSYKDQREFDGMEAAIQKAEARLAELTEASLSPEFASQPAKLIELSAELAKQQSEVERLYARWAELEG
jgi:ATP-binding cassette subfamily F protein uup